MQLDHFFILTKALAPEAELLRDLGMMEGTSNDHRGQGTANRRFFFSNTALELLYVRDEQEAKEGPGRRLRLLERASNPDASPFGLVMRCEGAAERPPFAGWRYQPLYFDPGVSFLVAGNSERLHEPLCICLPDDRPSRSPQVRSKSPFTEVTELRVHVPVVKPSSVLKAMSEVERIRIEINSPHLLEIAFGHESEGTRRDFRPILPLVVSW